MSELPDSAHCLMLSITRDHGKRYWFIIRKASTKPTVGKTQQGKGKRSWFITRTASSIYIYIFCTRGHAFPTCEAGSCRFKFISWGLLQMWMLAGGVIWAIGRQGLQRRGAFHNNLREITLDVFSLCFHSVRWMCVNPATSGVTWCRKEAVQALQRWYRRQDVGISMMLSNQSETSSAFQMLFRLQAKSSAEEQWAVAHCFKHFLRQSSENLNRTKVNLHRKQQVQWFKLPTQC